MDPIQIKFRLKNDINKPFGTAALKYIPRVGEWIDMYGRLFTVEQVVHKLEDGISQECHHVVIILKP